MMRVRYCPRSAGDGVAASAVATVTSALAGMDSADGELQAVAERTAATLATNASCLVLSMEILGGVSVRGGVSVSDTAPYGTRGSLVAEISLANP
jgi:hypothetical protein